jgi:hypothetical protein
MGPVQKFSINYVPAEDRLALDAEDAGGVTTRLWLTERLCRGMVPHLIKLLTERTAAKASGAVARSTVQSWAQLSAMQGLGETRAVQLKPDAPGGLVTTVHITPANGRFQIRFEFGERSLAIDYDEDALRQTLTLLARLYRLADWPGDLWPDWILDPVPEPAVRTVN